MLYSTDMPTDAQLYEQLVQIRFFEETVLTNFSKGLFFGTTHSCIGQEANAVGVINNIQHDDIVLSNHRSHGHFLAYGGDSRSLFAELMGRSTGVVGGRGGTQHLHWKNFYSNGIQGGILPIATGLALAEKLKAKNTIVIVFLGDGTLGEGIVYESLNMASLWKVPILFVLENNRIAQTTPIEKAVAGDIKMRFNSFDIPAEDIESSDVIEISQLANKLIKEVRFSISPRAIIIHTNRFGPHSKGDDTRDNDEILRMRMEHDPIQIQGQRLDINTRNSISTRIEREIQKAFNEALDDPFPEPEKEFALRFAIDGNPVQ